MDHRFKHSRGIGRQEQMKLFGIDLPYFITSVSQHGHIGKKPFLPGFSQVVKKVLIPGALGSGKEKVVLFHVGIDDLTHHIDFGILPSYTVR